MVIEGESQVRLSYDTPLTAPPPSAFIFAPLFPQIGTWGGDGAITTLAVPGDMPTTQGWLKTLHRTMSWPTQDTRHQNAFSTLNLGLLDNVRYSKARVP